MNIQSWVRWKFYLTHSTVIHSLIVTFYWIVWAWIVTDFLRGEILTGSISWTPLSLHNNHFVPGPSQGQQWATCIYFLYITISSTFTSVKINIPLQSTSLWKSHKGSEERHELSTNGKAVPLEQLNRCLASSVLLGFLNEPVCTVSAAWARKRAKSFCNHQCEELNWDSYTFV